MFEVGCRLEGTDREPADEFKKVLANFSKSLPSLFEELKTTSLMSTTIYKLAIAHVLFIELSNLFYI